MDHVTRVLCVCVWFVYMSDYSTVSGQGRMLHPPGRSSMWRMGYDTPVNDNDNLLSCGGVEQRWVINNGKCGVCGDPWDSKPRDNEAGGKYAKEIITSVFTSGALVEVTIDVAIVNGGYFEFRLCANNDFKQVVTQECLDSGLLVVNSTNTTRYESINDGLNHILLHIPDHVTCDQCVLQWKYRTADHYGCNVNKTTHEETCGFGLGKYQTEYYACSDIAIYSFKDKEKIQDKQNKHKIKTFNVVNENNNEHITKSPSRLKRTIHTFHAPLMPQFVSYKPDYPARNEQYNTVIDTGYGWNTHSMAHPLEFPRARSRRQLDNYRRSFSNRHAFTRKPARTRNSRVKVGSGQMFPGINVVEAPERSLIEGPRVTRQLIRTSAGRSVPTHVIRGEETIISTRPAFHQMGERPDTFISPYNPHVSVQTTNTISKHYIPTKQCNACPFNQCMDDNLKYDSLFPGLFENPLTFLECRRYEKLYNIGAYKTVSEGLPECGIHHTRFRRQLSPRMRDDDDGGCCTTRADVIMPLTVKSDNETFAVVQLQNDKNQFMVQGICGGNSTRSCNKCEAENNFQWVLVYDPRSTSNPPVSFVPVKFNHYCRCRNPGRRTG